MPVKRHPVIGSSESIHQSFMDHAVTVNADASAFTLGVQAHANLISECDFRDFQSKNE